MQISREWAVSPLPRVGVGGQKILREIRGTRWDLACSLIIRMESTHDVEKKIKAAVYLTTPKQGKSDIWTQFSIVTEKNGKELNFVSCNKCAKVFIYNGHKSGTYGLRRHTCTVLSGQSKLSFPNKALPAHVKQDTMEKIRGSGREWTQTLRVRAGVEHTACERGRSWSEIQRERASAGL
ncbi:zinc finger protein 618-like [Tachysurus ichikawai]